MAAISVIGGGYVGLVTAACLARLGHFVTCIETAEDRLGGLQEGRLPIREPGLEDLWRLGHESGRLVSTDDYAAPLNDADFIFLAVGTPAGEDGFTDLTQIDNATDRIASSLPLGSRSIVVVKSTVPVGTAERVAQRLAERLAEVPPVVSNPEFLREGQAILDFMRPARVVIGGLDSESINAVAALYQPLKRPVFVCSNRAAELIKYASNAFLCAKVSFINEIAAICEATGVDVNDVAQAAGMDPRIGHSYFDAGLGWGGSCLPKDVRSLVAMASEQGITTPMLRSAMEVNDRQPRLIIRKLRSLVGDLGGTTIAVLGLAFKPNCDDVRDSPALALIQLLLAEGANIRAYDPLAIENAKLVVPEAQFCASPYDAAEGAHAVVLATQWSVFQEIDYRKLASLVAGRILVDGRNALDVAVVTGAGFIYSGIGRETVTPETPPVSVSRDAPFGRARVAD